MKVAEVRGEIAAVPKTLSGCHIGNIYKFDETKLLYKHFPRKTYILPTDDKTSPPLFKSMKAKD